MGSLPRDGFHQRVDRADFVRGPENVLVAEADSHAEGLELARELALEAADVAGVRHGHDADREGVVAVREVVPPVLDVDAMGGEDLGDGVDAPGAVGAGDGGDVALADSGRRVERRGGAGHDADLSVLLGQIRGDGGAELRGIGGALELRHAAQREHAADDRLAQVGQIAALEEDHAGDVAQDAHAIRQHRRDEKRLVRVVHFSAHRGDEAHLLLAARRLDARTGKLGPAGRELEDDRAVGLAIDDVDHVLAAAEAARAAVSSDKGAVKSAEESVRGAEAAVTDARLALGYCTIQSPLSGRTGLLLVDRGNLVKANDTALVVINQLQPIYVGFSMPERYLSRIRQSMQERSLEVKVVVPHDDAPAATGALTFINNTVDPATGTIGCKATFDNDDERLWPGQFVNVSLEVAVHANALEVPTQAVQMGQSGPYTYVVKPDLTAELRTLKVGAEQNGMTIVEEGVQLGEKVVTDGQLRLAPGKTVQIVDGSAE